MSSLVTCAGLDVLPGRRGASRISAPQRGRWSADLALDTDTAPSGSVQIVAEDGFTLQGFVLARNAGVELDVGYVRVVAGAGGLHLDVTGSFQSAQLRDALEAIMDASGETLSSTISDDVLGVTLPQWTLGTYRASRALDELADFAGVQLGQDVGWRVLADGTIWMGAETWPAQAMLDDDGITERFPAERRSVLGVATLTLLPGVNLDQVGQVVHVDHWIGASELRTWAWV